MSCLSLWSAEDAFDELFRLAPEKVHAVKEVGQIKASGPHNPPACLCLRVKWEDIGLTPCLLGAG